MPNWNLIATPAGSDTALRIECRREPGLHGRYRLIAFDGDRWVHASFYDWNRWMGHASGQLLMTDFVAVAEKAAQVVNS